MKAISLASGSKGNSYLITTDKTKILVDLGICESELLAKLEMLKVSPEDIDAIFITHEHDDHIKGLQTFLKDYSFKVDNYEHSCNNFKKDSFYLEIKAVTLDGKVEIHKIPLILEDCK